MKVSPQRSSYHWLQGLGCSATGFLFSLPDNNILTFQVVPDSTEQLLCWLEIKSAGLFTVWTSGLCSLGLSHSASNEQSMIPWQWVFQGLDQALYPYLQRIAPVSHWGISTSWPQRIPTVNINPVFCCNQYLGSAVRFWSWWLVCSNPAFSAHRW